jgi:hypothetical protein
MFKVYKRKIDIFKGRKGAWVYVCSTNAAKTCRDAVKRYKEVHGIPEYANTVKAFFAKD